MFKGIIVAGCLVVVGFCSACVVSAQDASGRARDLVAQLDKTKTKVKDKGSVHISIFVDVKNTPVTQKPAEFAGKYISPESADYRMDLTVAPDGSVTATGYDTIGVEAKRVSYTLKGRIDGSMLTGTRTFEDGRTEDFEACFVNRTVRSGRTEADATVTSTAFGLGYIEKGDHWNSRVFLEKM
jgi:hypothetical protein